jgi:sugar transferase (PEP-CTERM/EpsH1 system associated)
MPTVQALHSNPAPITATRHAPARCERSCPIPIVHLVDSLEVGGLEKVVCDLCRLANRDQFAPTVICLQTAGKLTADLAGSGVPIISLDCPTLSKSRTLWRLVRQLRWLRPAVLHTHNPTPHFFGAAAAVLLGIPVLVHTKHGRNHPHRGLAVTKNRFVSWPTDCIVAVSADAAQVVTEVERIPPHKVQLIWNGIDLTRFPPNLDNGRPFTGRAIHVARLNAVKDQDTLLRAARLVADRHPGFTLDIVGDGPREPELKRLHAALGLEDCVRFLGYRGEVGRLLRQADLFVLSSVSEGVSLTLLEAMASSLPIVATAVGGNGEVVVPGETGLLVPPQAPEALATATLSLLNDPNRARQMGQRGRQRAEEWFDVCRVVGRYEQLYLDLLRQRGRCKGTATDGRR